MREGSIEICHLYAYRKNEKKSHRAYEVEVYDIKGRHLLSKGFTILSLWAYIYATSQHNAKVKTALDSLLSSHNFRPIKTFFILLPTPGKGEVARVLRHYAPDF